MKRIGILTSGGDCQGLNASIRGVAKSLYEEFGNDVEIYGIKDGYKGLIFGEYKLMKPEDFSGILTLGGTIWVPPASRSSSCASSTKTASIKSRT